MFNNVTDLLLIVGAIAWWSTALVLKDGPFEIFALFRKYVFLFSHKLHVKTPLTCTFCTGFWVGLGIILLWLNGYHAFVSFFGILGIAGAVRGASAEF